MKIAIISDIHANLEAFQTVLNDIRQSGIRHILTLGDNIGYGPDPVAVLSLLKTNGIQTLMGNHEIAVKDRSKLAWFNPIAQKALLRTVEFLSPEDIDYISSLRDYLIFDTFRFVHGFPPDSPMIYLFQISANELENTLRTMTETICFIGHTHELNLICFDGKNLHRPPFKKGVTRLDRSHKYIINVGSVGQPRDGDRCAKYVILDTTEYTIDLRYIPYDRFKTAEKIISAGLPKQYADRLL